MGGEFDWGVIWKYRESLWDGLATSFKLFGIALTGASSSARCSPWRACRA